MADLVYACATEADVPIHNPSGADAQMLVGLMSRGTRDDFVNQIRTMLSPT